MKSIYRVHSTSLALEQQCLWVNTIVDEEIFNEIGVPIAFIHLSEDLQSIYVRCNKIMQKLFAFTDDYKKLEYQSDYLLIPQNSHQLIHLLKHLHQSKINACMATFRNKSAAELSQKVTFFSMPSTEQNLYGMVFNSFITGLETTYWKVNLVFTIQKIKKVKLKSLFHYQEFGDTGFKFYQIIIDHLPIVVISIKINFKTQAAEIIRCNKKALTFFFASSNINIIGQGIEKLMSKEQWLFLFNRIRIQLDETNRKEIQASCRFVGKSRNSTIKVLKQEIVYKNLFTLHILPPLLNFIKRSSEYTEVTLPLKAPSPPRLPPQKSLPIRRFRRLAPKKRSLSLIDTDRALEVFKSPSKNTFFDTSNSPKRFLPDLKKTSPREDASTHFSAQKVGNKIIVGLIKKFAILKGEITSFDQAQKNEVEIQKSQYLKLYEKIYVSALAIENVKQEITNLNQLYLQVKLKMEQNYSNALSMKLMHEEDCLNLDMTLETNTVTFDRLKYEDIIKKCKKEIKKLEAPTSQLAETTELLKQINTFETKCNFFIEKSVIALLSVKHKQYKNKFNSLKKQHTLYLIMQKKHIFLVTKYLEKQRQINLLYHRKFFREKGVIMKKLEVYKRELEQKFYSHSRF